jgi:TRAP-type mannitol/chloroaromatic compound transport system permease small subunit
MVETCVDQIVEKCRDRASVCRCPARRDTMTAMLAKLNTLLNTIADIVDRVNAAIGRAVAWLVLAVVLLQFTLVVARYLFGIGSIWLTEAVIYGHATLLMLAAAWTLKSGGHVRVDIFYADASPRTQAKVDLLGALLLLLPFALTLVWLSMPYVARSWAVLERSQEASGLPLVYGLKTLIPAFAVLMALQGVTQAIRALGFLIPPPLAGEGDRRSRAGGG